MAKEREYTWYIEPSRRNFAHTNEVVSRMLAESNSTSSDFDAGTSMRRDFPCADGKLHTLYYVPSGLLFMLWSSRDGLKISFKIFCQEGQGKIRDVTEWYRSRHQKRVPSRYAKF